MDDTPFDAADPPGPAPRMRCSHCGDVVGAYEPLVVHENGAVRHTSRAAEAGRPMAVDAVYHWGCYISDSVDG